MGGVALILFSGGLAYRGVVVAGPAFFTVFTFFFRHRFVHVFCRFELALGLPFPFISQVLPHTFWYIDFVHVLGKVLGVFWHDF